MIRFCRAVYDCLEELGIEIGRSISVVGFDDRELAAYYQPSLTTMALPLHNIGYAAARRMIAILEDECEEKDYICPVNCELKKRESVCTLGWKE